MGLKNSVEPLACSRTVSQFLACRITVFRHVGSRSALFPPDGGRGNSKDNQQSINFGRSVPVLRIHSNFELPMIGRSRRSGRTGDDRIWRTLVETQLAPIESMTDVTVEGRVSLFLFFVCLFTWWCSFTSHQPPATNSSGCLVRKCPISQKCVICQIYAPSPRPPRTVLD